VQILKNREANRITAITMWRSEADLLASTQDEYFQDQLSRMIIHLTRPPQFDTHELDVV
jgi:hypothetical protein